MKNYVKLLCTKSVLSNPANVFRATVGDEQVDGPGSGSGGGTKNKNIKKRKYRKTNLKVKDAQNKKRQIDDGVTYQGGDND